MSSLGWLSIEKEHLNTLMESTTSDFYDKVNNDFGAIHKISHAKFRLFGPPLRHATSHFLEPPIKYNVTKARTRTYKRFVADKLKKIKIDVLRTSRFLRLPLIANVTFY